MTQRLFLACVLVLSGTVAGLCSLIELKSQLAPHTIHQPSEVDSKILGSETPIDLAATGSGERARVLISSSSAGEVQTHPMVGAPAVLLPAATDSTQAASIRLTLKRSKHLTQQAIVEVEKIAEAIAVQQSAYTPPNQRQLRP